MKVTQIILTKIFFDNTTRNMSLRKNPTVKFKFGICREVGGVANWCRLGYELSVVNLTPYVV